MKFCALFLSDTEAILRLWFGTHTCGHTVIEKHRSTCVNLKQHLAAAVCSVSMPPLVSVIVEQSSCLHQNLTLTVSLGGTKVAMPSDQRGPVRSLSRSQSTDAELPWYMALISRPLRQDKRAFPANADLAYV